jgi:hypothetical protein
MSKDRTSAGLIAVVTALLMIAPAGRAAAATLDQLVTIDNMIAQRDWGALWSYVNANPSLLVGNDPLAVELRRFILSMNTETMDAYAQTPFVTDRPPHGTY